MVTGSRGRATGCYTACAAVRIVVVARGIVNVERCVRDALAGGQTGTRVQQKGRRDLDWHLLGSLLLSPPPKTLSSQVTSYRKVSRADAGLRQHGEGSLTSRTLRPWSKILPKATSMLLSDICATVSY
jgi:hypothetical protein